MGRIKPGSLFFFLPCQQLHESSSWQGGQLCLQLPLVLGTLPLPFIPSVVDEAGFLLLLIFGLLPCPLFGVSALSSAMESIFCIKVSFTTQVVSISWLDCDDTHNFLSTHEITFQNSPPKSL